MLSPELKAQIANSFSASTSSVPNSLEMESPIATKNAKQNQRVTETDWRAVWITFATAFLMMVESGVVSIAEWPYMQQVDSQATVAFKGEASSLMQATRAVSCLCFGFWQYRWQQSKFPLIFGRLIAYTGIVLYLLVELFPSNRRYVMMSASILFAIASSSTSVLRAYSVRISSDEDRAKVFALLMLAALLSVVLSPLTQLAFSSIRYPGYQILPNVLFHAYSAPAWLALFTNTIAVVIICCFFRDPKRKALRHSSQEAISIERVKRILRTLRNVPFSWTLVAVVMFVKVVEQYNMSMLSTMIQPMLMVLHGLDGIETVRATSILMVVVGICAICVAALFILAKLAERVSLPILFTISLLGVLGMFIVTYPYPTAEVVHSFNATTGSGCSSDSYTWCDSANVGFPAGVFLVTIACVLGISAPLNLVSLDTIYSKIIGSDVDQSIMQSIIVVVQDVAVIFAPMLTTWIFTDFGVPPVWISSMCATVAGIIVWIGAYRWIRKYA